MFTDHTRDDSIDAIVIGAGMGGLSSALTLATSGLRVRLFEALDGPGGKVGTQRHDGVEFDTGPSLMTMVTVLRDLVEDSGADFEETFDLIEHTPAFRYIWPDGCVFDVHHDLDDTRRSAREVFGPKGAQQFEDFMEYSRKIWEAARPNFIEGGAPSIGSMFKLGLTKLGAVTKIDPLRTMAQGIDRHITEPHLRDVMLRYATYNGSNPFSAPATLNCIAYVEMGEGGWGIRGGMAELPRQLANLASDAGVEMRYHTPVRRILTGPSGAIEGVETEDGERHRASIVVANADVAHVTNALLDETVRHDIPEIEEPSMSGWNAIMRAHHNTAPPRAAHTALFPEEYGEEFHDIFERGRPPQTPTVYLCDQRRAHGREGWEDADAVFVMANCPPEPTHGATAPEVFERLRRRVKERLQGHGLMGPHDHFVWERTPTDLAQTFQGSRGAIYGAASNSQMAAFKRPPNRVARLPGLYLASGSAHPGGGVPLCLMSGRTAAREALEDSRKSTKQSRRAP